MVVGSDHGTMQISVVIPAYNAALYIDDPPVRHAANVR